jgi:hypothetical protein
MAKDDDINFEKEKAQHEATLRKFKHLDVEERRAKAEAVEKAMAGIARKVHGGGKNEKVRQSMAKDFLNKYKGRDRPDPDLINFLRGTGGGSLGGVNNEEYEPGIPTGIAESEGDLPWQDDDDL